MCRTAGPWGHSKQSRFAFDTDKGRRTQKHNILQRYIYVLGMCVSPFNEEFEAMCEKMYIGAKSLRR